MNTINHTLHRHIVDVLLDAADHDHPINIALQHIPNLLKIYESTDDFSYIGDLRWTDPTDGELNELNEEHMDELYAMHLLALDLLNNHERDIAEILLSRLDREAFLIYLGTDEDATDRKSTRLNSSHVF